MDQPNSVLPLKSLQYSITSQWALANQLFIRCLLVSPYYSYPNQRSWVYSKFICLYFVTSVSRGVARILDMVVQNGSHAHLLTHHVVLRMQLNGGN